MLVLFKELNECKVKAGKTHFINMNQDSFIFIRPMSRKLFTNNNISVYLLSTEKEKTSIN